MKRYILQIFAILFITTILEAQEEISALHKKLLSIPNITVKSIESDSKFTEAYEIFITQPVDHLNPNNGPKFTQQIFLHHVDFMKPMVMETDGYAVTSRRKTELAKILNCNEIIVEHRYFDESTPDSVDWKYLNTAQAAADHKRIVDLFKTIYTGKWISTGISKGGQTTIFFKYYYPDAVDVWVPYVAPLNLEQEDRRINEFLDNVGTDECREKIKKYQRALLENREEILPLFEDRMNEKGYRFNLGLDKTFELAVLEYSFAFWQWGKLSCEDIPEPTSSAEELFKPLYTASSFNYFDSTSMIYYQPFFYQAYTEIGYYNYATEDFSDLLTEIKDEYQSNISFAPQNIELNFNKSLMNNINKYIQENGNNMLYIYGGNDTWSSTAVEIGSKTNAVKMVKKGGNHRTRINSFDGEEKELIFSTLEKWLDVKIDR